MDYEAEIKRLQGLQEAEKKRKTEAAAAKLKQLQYKFEYRVSNIENKPAHIWNRDRWLNRTKHGQVRVEMRLANFEEFSELVKQGASWWNGYENDRWYGINYAWLSGVILSFGGGTHVFDTNSECTLEQWERLKNGDIDVIEEIIKQNK